MDTIARTAKQMGAAFRRFRRQKGLTQRSLGELMPARQATVSKLESGESGVQLGVLIARFWEASLELRMPGMGAEPS